MQDRRLERMALHQARSRSEIHLTRIEYRLLEILIRHADQIVTHQRLLNEVWGRDHASQVQYLRVYMLQLRKKLEADPSRPRYLRTEPGVGYRLVTEHYPEAWNENLVSNKSVVST